MDIVSPAIRSRMMAGIGARHTAPELSVRRYLHATGLRFRLHVGGLLGRPDIVLPRYRTVVFVHGCFWHRHSNCKFATTPSTRADFWQSKFRANQARDIRVRAGLEAAGWNVIVVWECETGSVERLEDLFWGIVLNETERNSPQQAGLS